jgi:serine/threonine protein phosphatase PrpC
MEVLRGNIKQEDIRFHPNRNKVLRALGIEGVYPEISGVQKVCIGDAFLLCSDGFWEFITENEMLIDLSKSRNAEEWVSFMLWRVGSRIQAGTDNLSAVAMIINQ